MSRNRDQQATPERRHRLTKEQRRQQLLKVAWTLIRREGADALTLGRLAEQAGVTKPLVYHHFETRGGLLAALYEEFEARQHALMEAALRAAPKNLVSVADVIASSYVDCVLSQGREISGVIAALAGSPELEKVKRRSEAEFLDRCRAALAPFAARGVLPLAGLRAMLGAAEALSLSAARRELTAAQAKDELTALIVAMVSRDR